MKKTKKQQQQRQTAPPLVEQSEQLMAAYGHFNKTLFEGKLSPAMVLFTRNPKILGGYFSENKWFNGEGRSTHEITINANHMAEGDEVQLYQVLLHEMTHLWQFEHGTPGRGGYHNLEWAEFVKSIGLKPLSITQEGVETGDSITTELITGGLAMKAIANLPPEVSIPWYAVPMDLPGNGQQKDKDKDQEGGSKEGKDEPPPSRQGKKTKYTCVKCGFNLWGKSGGVIQCVPCGVKFTEMQ